MKFVNTTKQIAEFYQANFDILHIIDPETDVEEENYIKKTSNNLIKDLNSKLIIIRDNKPEEITKNLSAEYDLLITGTPKHNDWASLLFGSGKDKFAVNSACSVLRLTIKN